MNNCNLMGRLAADPKLMEFESGSVLCRFILAVNRIKSNKESKVDYIPCQAWGDYAKLIATTLHKGQRIVIYNSDIETDSYIHDDGGKRYTWWVNVGRFEYVEKKEE